MTNTYSVIFNNITKVMNQSFKVIGYDLTVGNILAFILIGSIFITLLKFMAN